MFQDRNELISKLEELRILMGDMPTVQGPLIGELWESWAKGMRQMKSTATVMSIKSTWKHLGPIIGERTLNEITGEFWTNEIIPKVRAKTHPGFKFFNMRKWLAMFLKWSEENRKAPKDWRRPRLVDPDPERAPGRAYSIDETNRLFAHADLFLQVKLVMSLEHFMRRSEVALLSKDRVDRVKRIIHLRAEDTKIRKARSFPYNERLESLLVQLDAKHAEMGIVSPWVFPSPIDPMKSIGRDGFSSAWQTCKRRANVVGKWHWLRHTALTRAARAPGANFAKICQFAGLRIDEFQRTYLHLDIDDLRGVEKWD